MKLLLDTHILLWALMAPSRLPPAVLAAIADPANDVMFSAINIWEVSIKRALGRPGFDFTPDDVLSAAREAGLAELPVTATHAARVLTLPPLHSDPFDRMLIAQALSEPARLLTADSQIARYPATVDLLAPN